MEKIGWRNGVVRTLRPSTGTNFKVGPKEDESLHYYYSFWYDKLEHPNADSIFLGLKKKTPSTPPFIDSLNEALAQNTV